MENVEKDELNLLSMNVILHAGNARDYVFQAVERASDGDFTESDKLMKQANDEVVEAHRAQTSTLQKKQMELKFLTHHYLDMHKIR